MNIVKGIGAVLLGIVFIFVTHAGTDIVLESLGIFTPPDAGFHITWMVITASIYRSIYTLIAGYITAAVAPEPKMRYVFVLAAIGLVLGAIGAIVTIPMNLSPAWYPIFLAISGPIFTIIGGKWRLRGGKMA